MSKEFINSILDEDLILVRAEITRLEELIELLTDEVYSLRNDNAGLNELIGELQDILNRFGMFLGEEFKSRLLTKIDEAQSSIIENESIIKRDIEDIETAEKDLPCVKKFKSDLEKLKKKDTEVASISIGSLTGEEIMEISIDKDGNARVSKIANAKGEALARKVQWFADGDDIAILTPSEDGLSCNVKGNGKAGSGSLFARVGKASDEDTELFESNHLPMLGIEKPDTDVAEFVIEEVLPA